MQYFILLRDLHCHLQQCVKPCRTLLQFMLFVVLCIETEVSGKGYRVRALLHINQLHSILKN